MSKLGGYNPFSHMVLGVSRGTVGRYRWRKTFRPIYYDPRSVTFSYYGNIIFDYYLFLFRSFRGIIRQFALIREEEIANDRIAQAQLVYA